MKYPSVLPVLRSRLFASACVASLFCSAGSLFAEAAGSALVRHAPAINGTVIGSIQQMAGESVTLNGGAVVTGDLLVPGSPTVRLNGNPHYAGTLEGTGSSSPSNYQVTLNGNVSLGHVVRRTNPLSIPGVAAPPQPTGTRSVTINSTGTSPGSFGTLRNLTLNGNVGQFAIPAGTYGDFIANGGSGFTFGVTGATTPAVYNFQHLTFNGQTQIQIVGPVIITVANGFTANGTVGSSAHSEWLTLNVYSGGFTLNGACNFFGTVNTPNGTVIINGNSQLIGGLTADRLTINGGGLLRALGAGGSNNAPIANSGSVQLNEDTTAPVVLGATDADGNSLSFTVVAAPAHGALSGVAPNLTYTPTADFNGSDSFTFKANDGQADSNIATVAITVLPVNDRPLADSKPLTLVEDTPASVILSGSDVDGDALTFAIAVGPSHGALSGTAPNLTYTPEANYHGSDSFTYVASDGSLNSAAATVSITVNAVNDAPVALNRSYSVSEGGSVSITLTGSDVDDDPLTFQRLTSTSNGTLTGTAPNFVYQPNPNFGGVDSFTFTASDGQATSAPATITINVTNLNFAPVANSAAAQTDEDAAAIITLTASDQDGDPLGFSIVAPPQHGTLGSVTSTGSGTATVTYMPAENYNGPDSFTFKARDTAFADSNVATISLTVQPVNDAPIADSRSVQADEDVPLAIELTGSDVEQSVLTYTVATQPQHGTLSGSAPQLTYTPSADYNGPDSFSFKVNDGQLDSAPATISIAIRAVNDAPVAASQSAATDEDTPLTLTLTATDVEGSTLTFAVVTPPQHGVLGTIAGVSPNSATVVYTPAADYNGSDSFTFKANDGDKDSDAATVTLAIAPRNDAPVAVGQDLVQPQDTPFNFTLSATDADGDSFSYTTLTPPTHGTLSGTAPNLTYTPSFNYRGGDSLVFKANDGQLDSNPATITFTMTPVSHPPVVSSGSPVSLDEDASATITLPASDLDGDALAYFIVTPPQHGTLGPITVASGVASVTYTPTANYNGSDRFSFKASDGAADSNEATIGITVRAVNDAPIASAEAVATDEDTPASFMLTATDVDGDTLSYSAVTTPAHGTLSGTAPNLVYTPAANYNGPDSFTFKVNDGTADSNVATVSITVAALNDAPVAVDRTVNTSEDTSVAIVLTATDVDSSALTFAIVSPPQHGTLSGSAPNFAYKPAADFNGSDGFTYKANDGALDSALATVSITIAPVNDAPVANPLTISTSSGAPTAIVLTGSDVDNATLTFTVAASPQHGTLTGTPPNLTYTSNASFGGFDSFTFVANDGQLNSAPATVQIISGLPPRSRTYTTTADFTAGTLTSVSTDTSDQISNRTILGSYDVVWIANSSKGTVVKLDAETGRALGEYLTTPAGIDTPYPSRVAIDSKGNAWVANYSYSSIVKIGQPDNGFWSDRNHDGVVTSSTGLGDIKPWTGTDIAGAGDEAILLYVRTDVTGGVRDLSVDADDNVWVGGPNGVWQKYDGRTGALLRNELGTVGGGMGGFITSDGKLYSAGASFLIWNTSGPLASQPPAANIRANTWAQALDSHGNLWCTRDGASTIAKYSPTGQLIGEYYHGEPWGMGIAIDASDHVWIAHSHCGHSVGHLLPDGTWVGNVEVANHGPVNVSIDRHGRIWVASSTGVVERINPLGGSLGSDGVTPIGDVDLKSGNLGGALWTYGRFTGSAFALSAPDGFWTNVYDGILSGTTWGRLSWSGLICNDARIEVEAALSADGTTFGPFQSLSPTNPTPAGAGRFLKTRVRLVSASSGETPALYDLTVGTAGYIAPVTSPSWYVSAGADIAGNWPDVIQLKGAFCHSTHVFPVEPTYSWLKISGPGDVTFSNSADKRSTAQFGAQGTYVLRLTATLGSEVSSDDVRVTLTPYNRAPYANAGYTTFIASFPPQIWLWGTVRDDGLPLGATVTPSWRQLFGPGTATFGDSHAALTTVTFSVPGVYTLNLSATDTELTSDNTTDVWIGVPPPPPPPSGLVSWWEASGNGDDHISGNQAFLEKAADYSNGKIGGAFRFNGFNNRVRVFAAPSLDVGQGGGLTVEFWVQPTSNRNGASIFQYGSGATRGVQVLQDFQNVQVDFRDTANTSHLVSVPTVLFVNTWTHVAASYDRATGEARVYINGILQLRQVIGSFTPATKYDIFMGAAADGTQPFQGLIDELGIYDRALYGDEVLTLATLGKRPPVANLPPVVDAGRDLYNQHVNAPVALVGTVTDDGQPTNGALTTQWTQVIGPGVVAFADATARQTTATFPVPGKYVLKLTADDGAFSASDTATIVVDSLYRFDTDSSITAWWTGNGTDLDEVHATKLERINGPAFADGKIAQAFSFDGSNDRARVLPSAAIDVGSAAQGYTIEFWIKPARAANDTLLQWRDKNGNIQLQLGTFNGYFRIGGRNAAGDVQANPDADLPSTLNQWQHLAYSYNRATGELAMYLNGKRLFVGPAPWGSVTLATNGALWVGSGLDGNSPFQGQLDEFTLYRRPLLPDEILAIYQSSGIGKAPLDDNTAPTGVAGPARVVADVGIATNLAGVVTDDGQPAHTTQVTWTKLAGPGGVSFGDSTAANTTATFDTPGIYTLRLDANDTLNQGAGDVVEVRVGIAPIEPAAGITAWWSGNGHAHDSIHGHDIQLVNGAGYDAGKVEQAFNFDGSDDLAWVPGHSDLAIGASPQGFTIEFWMKDIGGSNRTMLQWRDAAGNTQLQVSSAYYFGTFLAISARDSAGTNWGMGGPGGVYYTGNQWNHFAFTYDPATGEMKSYLNGTLQLTVPWGAITIPTNGTLWIGSGANGVSRFQGLLDEITLYKRPLSYTEINAIYAAGAVGKAPPDDNAPPTVSAGPDLVLPDIGATATLNGTVSDDNKPFGAPGVQWTVVDGPGHVFFGDKNSAATTATFDAPGNYLLKLTGDDRYSAPVSDLTLVRVGVTTGITADTSLAAWWPANGDPREIVHGGHDVELVNGTTYAAGKVSQGFSFDGSDDLAWVYGHPDLAIGTSAQGFTIEFWFKPARDAGETLLQWRDDAGHVQMEVHSGFYFGRYLALSLRDSSGVFHGSSNTDGTIYYPIGVWNHIAFTYEPGTGSFAGYLNGVRQFGLNIGSFTVPTDGRLWLGSAGDGSARFRGLLDELTLYRRPLSAAQIAAVYNAGAAGKLPNSAPVVSAGADLAAYAGIATPLVGSASDDGFPNPPGALTYQWSVVSGPGNVAFSAADALATDASFDALGTYTLRLTASDSALSASDDVTVSVSAPPSQPPTIAIYAPASGGNLPAATYFEVAAHASDPDGAIAKVEFFQGATKLGEQTAPALGDPTTYFWPLTNGLPVGNYTFTARATDNSGASTTSAPISVGVVADNRPPGTLLAAPTDGSRISAPTPITGVVSGALLASWTVERRLKTAEGLAPEAWTTVSSGTNPVGTPAAGSTPATPGTLGTFDPTLLLNGIYELRLSATDTIGRTVVTGPISVIVEGNMKVGAFTLAFEDMKVPVAGIPITVTRTYDSRDVRMGDFGPGWRLALNNIRVQKNRNLGTGWFQTLQSGSGIQFYNVDPIGDRLVTVTMPDGETHRFKIGAVVKNRVGDPDDASFAAVVTQGTLKFYPIGDTTSTLEPLDGSNQLLDHFFIAGTGNQDLTATDDFDAPAYNTTRFRLTTKDGTVFVLDEALGLLSMTDLNGNTLVLDRDAQNRVTGVTSTQNAASSPVVTSVTIHRDATGRVDYIRDPAGHDLDYLYDTQGRLSSFTNRESDTTQFRYENASFPYYLTKIIDPRGVNAIRSEFDSNGKLIKQIDADGKETVFNRGVDTTGRFEKVKDRLGNETTFYYDDRGNVTLKIDPLGAQTSYSYYPDSDRVRFEIDHYGNAKSMAYDDRGNVTVETIGASATEDPASPTTGHTTRTTYNAQSSPTQLVDPDGRKQSFTYDASTGDLLTQTLGAGGTAPSTTTYTYNSDGTLKTITDAVGNITSHDYDYGFNDAAYPGAVKKITVTVTDPAGTAGSDHANTAATVLRTTQTLYDAQENQLAQIATRHLPDGTAEDVVTRYVYDTESRLVATIMPDGRVTETRYTSFGKEEKSVLWKSVADYQGHDDANARLTSYGYDDRGNQTSVTYADGTTELMHFDLENRKDWSQDRRGYRTFFTYDAVGRLRFTIFPDADDGVGSAAPATAIDSRLANNPQRETRYDLVGRVRFEVDERGNVTEFTYEDGCSCAMRRKEMIQHRALGNLVTHYEYDGAGNVTFVTDPRGNTVETRYDDQGRPTTVVYPATDEHPVTQSVTHYDVLGRRIEAIDQEGKVTRYRYDALGRLIEVRQYIDAAAAPDDSDFSLSSSDARVAITRYTYDELGNQRTQTDALGRTTTFSTDNLGRRTKRVLPKDATESTALSETLQYDEWGNLWKRTDFAGKTTTFGYDTLNRLKSKAADATHPSLAYSHAIARIEYDYDANGTRTAAHTFNASDVQLYAESTPHDERGRLRYKDTAAGRLDYSYYANNLLKDAVSSNSGGLNVGYRYDELNRLEAVDDTSTGLPTRTTGYTYNANGSLETLTQPNAVVHTYDYDALNRLRGLVVSRGTTLLHTYEYKLNPSGHRRQVIENSTRTTTYGYDDVYRLKSETILGDTHGQNGEVSYDLDQVGNRKNRTSSVASVLSALNQSYNSRDWLNGDSYDANGNTITGQLADLAVRGNDVYDFENRLIFRTKADGSSINISYDADGNRIAKSILNSSAQSVSSTAWLVDTNNLTGYAQVVEERSQIANPASQITRTYTYGTQLLSQAVSLNSQPSTLNYYAFDGHGNFRELTDSTGSVTDRYDYDAFGNLTFSSGTTANMYRYAGEQYDTDLGLYYNRARYLNTGNGRFWSTDSYEGITREPKSLHKYIYVGDDPIGAADPSGHESLVELQTVEDVDQRLNQLSIPNVRAVGQKTIKRLICITAQGVAREGQIHHLATNKNYVAGKQFSKAFEEIFEKAGLELDHWANKLVLAGHKGPHPQKYHEEVLKLLKDGLASTSVEGLAADAAEQVLQEVIENTLLKIAGRLCNSSDPLTQLVAP